jgi:hypothetical protein
MDERAQTIEIPFPEAPNPHLRIRVGACRLHIAPGDAGWVSGTYSDAAAARAKIEQEGGTVRITQEYVGGGWGFLFRGAFPRFDLKLGRAKPYLLSLETGASDGTLNLGGLPITRLVLRQGAGRGIFDFSAPNPQPMSLFGVHAGAVSLEMKNLANANFGEMRLEGGAASYKFDFGGSLARDAHVQIETGMSSVEIRVPGSTAARIAAECALGHLEIGDRLTKREGLLWTEAALAGKTPVLTIQANLTMGSLQVRVY